MKIKIDYQFTTLNEYINAERTNKFKASAIKKKETDIIRNFVTGNKVDKYPIKITFYWHLKDKRKDLDNIAFAKKFILDGLVKYGVLKNDGLNYIQGLKDIPIFDTKQEYVEIEIKEVLHE